MTIPYGPRRCYRCSPTATLPPERFTWRSNGKPFSACKACNLEMARARRAALTLLGLTIRSVSKF